MSTYLPCRLGPGHSAGSPGRSVMQHRPPVADHTLDRLGRGAVAAELAF